MTIAEQLRHEGFQDGLEAGFTKAKTIAEQLRQKGYNDGLETGIAESRTEIALKLKQKGISPDIIATTTGIDKKTLEQLFAEGIRA